MQQGRVGIGVLPGIERAFGDRTYPVAFTNLRNSVTVTGWSSIQNPPASTRRTGASSG
jgi:hypothetical protein